MKHLPPIPELPGFTLSLTPEGAIVGLCEFRGRMLVATERHLYELIDGVWHTMVFAAANSAEAPPDA